MTDHDDVQILQEGFLFKLALKSQRNWRVCLEVVFSKCNVLLLLVLFYLLFPSIRNDILPSSYPAKSSHITEIRFTLSFIINRSEARKLNKVVCKGIQAEHIIRLQGDVKPKRVFLLSSNSTVSHSRKDGRDNCFKVSNRKDGS